MILISSSAEIDRPKKVVYEFLINPANAPLWQSGMLEFEMEQGMPVGSRGHMVLQIMGQRITSRFEVLENDGAGVIRAISRQGPLKFETTQAVESIAPARTRMTIQTTIDAGLIFRLAEPALESIASARLDYDMNTIKTVLENMPN